MVVSINQTLVGSYFMTAKMRFGMGAQKNHFSEMVLSSILLILPSIYLVLSLIPKFKTLQ